MELTGFDQDEQGVTAHVRHHKDGSATDIDIRVSYLLGTDGAKGERSCFIRKQRL